MPKKTIKTKPQKPVKSLDYGEKPVKLLFIGRKYL